jgi:hypothetical protein
MFFNDSNNSLKSEPSDLTKKDIKDFAENETTKEVFMAMADLITKHSFEGFRMGFVSKGVVYSLTIEKKADI